MNNRTAVIGLVLCGCCLARAATHYVVPAGTPGTPTAQYLTWDTAATNIQDAVSVATNGSLVLVTNGTYLLTRTVVVTNSITLRSFNAGVVDRAGTVIDGNYPAVTNRCLYVSNTAATIDGFTLTNGYASTNSLGGYGGGFLLNPRGIVTNCLVTGNQAEGRGGGGYLISAGDGWVVDSAIVGNSVWTNVAASYGGGLFSYKSVVSNCVISGNSARWGGGVYMSAGGVSDGDGRLVNCVVSGNMARVGASGEGGAGVYMFFKGTIANCEIVTNRIVPFAAVSGYGAGVIIGSGGLLRDSQVRDNTGAAYGGGVQAGGGTTSLYCLVQNNSASTGGGIYLNGGMISHCSVISNSEAMFVQNGTARNCLFAYNKGGIWGVNGASAGVYENCTVASNKSGFTGFSVGKTGVFDNCIVYYNGGGNYSAKAIWTNSCTTPMPTGTYDVANITNDPQFVSLVAGDFRLRRTSPCINKGVNRVWMNGAVDLDGLARIQEETVDMGAYEIVPMPGTLIYVK